MIQNGLAVEMIKKIIMWEKYNKTFTQRSPYLFSCSYLEKKIPADLDAWFNCQQYIKFGLVSMTSLHTKMSTTAVLALRALCI